MNDATLNQLKELRPTTDDQLMLVGGFGAKALMHFAVPLLQVVKDFCDRSKHLKPTTDWHVVRRSRDAARQRGLQQANGQFAQWNGQQQEDAADGMFSEFAEQAHSAAGQVQQGVGHLNVQSTGGCQPGAYGVAAGATLVTDMQVYQVCCGVMMAPYSTLLCYAAAVPCGGHAC